MKVIRLSHFLKPTTPFYGDDGHFVVQAIRSIACGDACNASHWAFPNHAGTHVDLPFHFVDNGKRLQDYPPHYWIFKDVAVIHLENVRPGQYLEADVLEGHALPASTELVLLNTGFGRFRGTPTYWMEGPVISPAWAESLRSRCPHLRGFGIDCISISSWTNRPLGRETHRAFLGGESPILLIEDMDFSAIEAGTRFHRVTVAPLLVDGADASPCTVFAEVR